MFSSLQMELSSNLLEQKAFYTRPKIDEHLLFILDKPKHEVNLSQPLQTTNEKLKIAFSFLTGYNGSFIVTGKSFKFYFATSINDKDFSENSDII